MGKKRFLMHYPIASMPAMLSVDLTMAFFLNSEMHQTPSSSNFTSTVFLYVLFDCECILSRSLDESNMSGVAQRGSS